MGDMPDDLDLKTIVVCFELLVVHLTGVLNCLPTSS
jgi:hypothetical protein